ncbi:acyltransferase, partial [Pelagibacteraceae bacterium]|nr:acyltransferase [Pelagibacteraceae bacterium]
MDSFFKNYKITYRQDIDSLRGLAVLAVVLYHLAPGRMPGGFLGVDIFFVISGYLITTIIIKDDINNFSFLDFYFRRIKRLLPALLIVLTACSLAAFFFLPEIYFIQFAKHLSFSSIFVLNFTLLGENGYFDTSSIFKPLLHLWSLCIEEQFYIVWPLLIFFLKKNKINLLYFSFFAFIFSFLLNFFYLNDQIFTFYFPLTRFWELLLGSILSIVL